jgi:hypothetical protein
LIRLLEAATMYSCFRGQLPKVEVLQRLLLLLEDMPWAVMHLTPDSTPKHMLEVCYEAVVQGRLPTQRGFTSERISTIQHILESCGKHVASLQSTDVQQPA